MCFGGPKGIESTEKKTFTVGAGYSPSAARLLEEMNNLEIFHT